MRHFKTKVLSIALAVSLLVGSSTVFAYTQGDWETKDNATTIGVGQNLNVDLPAGTDGQWFKFSPEESGSYYIYSHSNSGDPYAYLYDSEGNYLTYNDDGAGNSNFRIQYDLVADETYYIWATEYWGNTCSYKISIAKTSDVEALSVTFGYSDNYYRVNGYETSTILYVPVGESITLSMSGTGDFAPYYLWYNPNNNKREVLATVSDYTFDCSELGLHTISAGCVNHYHYFYINVLDVPATFVNGAEKKYDSFLSVTWSNEQDGGEPRVALMAAAPASGATDTVNMPLVTSSFVVGTPVTIGVGEIEGAQYQWYDLNDTSNPVIIDGATGFEMVCDDLELGTHRFCVVVTVEGKEYVPVAFEITITESAPEPTPTPAPDPVVPSNPTYVAPPSDNHNDVESFVERFYVCALGRNADPEGKAYWAARLIADEYTGTQLARGFIYSREFISRNLSNEEYVTVLYSTFLGRTPDETGFAYWTGNLTSGSMSKDDVFLGFAQSREFGELCARYGISR